MDSLKNQYHKIADYECESSGEEATYRLKKDYHRLNILQPIREAFPLDRNIRVLEFGPGLGCLAELLCENYASLEYHAVDVDPVILEHLSLKIPQATIHAAECAEDLEQIPGTFDVIAAIDVWEHLSKDTAVFYTKWCYEHLNPGGGMILQMPNWGCPVTPAVFFGDLTHQLMFNEKTIRQLFRAAGVPEDEFYVLPRKTPYFAGRIRDALGTLFSWLYRFVFVFFGAARLRIFSADLVALIRKKSIPQSTQGEGH